MSGPAVQVDRTFIRRLVLGVVFMLALAVWPATTPLPAYAQPSPPATSNAKPPQPVPSDESTAPAQPPGADKGAPSAEVTVGPRGVTIDRHGKRVRVFGLDGDREYDSFDELAQDAPWLAGVVFFAVAMAFAVPLLIVIAVVWYKIRRARMMNETMLRLAEKGVVPPAGAIEALAGNKPEMAERAMVSAAPIAEQAKIATRRAAWSDLRKGIVMLAVGVGLTFWSMLDDGSPNGFGLVLMFVGIGYIVLWRFEERQFTPPRGGGPAAGT
jgi:hypothetical protein